MHDCPSCARQLPEGAAFCPDCGAPVVQEPAARPAVDDQEPTAKTLVGDEAATQTIGRADETARTQFMMPPTSGWTCASCGSQAEDGMRFCPHCGAEQASENPTVAVAPPTVACAACGAALADDVVFCPHCGARRGDVETADSREQTVIAPSLAAASPPPVGPATPASPPPPPPPPPAATAEGRGGRSRKGALIAAVAVVVLAAAGFCVWWFALRDTAGAAREDFVRQAAPVLQPAAAAQGDADRALTALEAADADTFADLRAAAEKLDKSVEDAQAAVAALALKEEAEPLRAKLKTALSAHAGYAAALLALPEAPADLTGAQVDTVQTRAASAQSAYDSLAAAAPDLPRVTLAAEAREHLDAVAAEAAEQQQAEQAEKTFLQQLSALFERSRAERENAEAILSQFESVELPPDNASGQMKAAAANLKSVLTQIDALVPPDEQALQQLQSQYHEAVQHWVSAAQLYAKWMWTAHGYYQAGGWYPDPSQGHEADLYLDPSYESARQEQDLADAARVTFVEAYDARCAPLGLPADYDASAL